MANSFWQREKRMKRYSTLFVFCGLETKELKKLLANKEEEEEVQKDVHNLCKKLYEKVIEMQVKVLLL